MRTSLAADCPVAAFSCVSKVLGAALMHHSTRGSACRWKNKLRSRGYDRIHGFVAAPTADSPELSTRRGWFPASAARARALISDGRPFAFSDSFYKETMMTCGCITCFVDGTGPQFASSCVHRVRRDLRAGPGRGADPRASTRASTVVVAAEFDVAATHARRAAAGAAVRQRLLVNAAAFLLHPQPLP